VLSGDRRVHRRGHLRSVRCPELAGHLVHQHDALGRADLVRERCAALMPQQRMG
jgi:hypothetical protein